MWRIELNSKASLHWRHKLRQYGFGVFLIIIGIIMAIPGVPGPGSISILLGILLFPFPGRDSIVKKLRSQWAFRKFRVWLYKRWGIFLAYHPRCLSELKADLEFKAEQISVFLEEELNQLKKELEAVYREDVAFHPEFPKNISTEEEGLHQGDEFSEHAMETHIRTIVQPTLNRVAQHCSKAHQLRRSR